MEPLYHSYVTEMDNGLEERDSTVFQEEQMARRRVNPEVSGNNCLILYSPDNWTRRHNDLLLKLSPQGADLTPQPAVHRDVPRLSLRLAGMTFSAEYGPTDFTRGDPLLGAPYYTTYKFRGREIYDGYGKITPADLMPYPGPSYPAPSTPLVVLAKCRGAYMQNMGRQDITHVLDAALPVRPGHTESAGPSNTSAMAYYRAGDTDYEYEVRQFRDFLCDNGVRRQNKHNHWMTTINNHVVAYERNGSQVVHNEANYTPLLIEVCSVTAAESELYAPGINLPALDIIRIFPAHHTAPRVPTAHTQVAGQLLACHGPHCGGKLDTNVYAVHTSEELNGDATWRFLPVGPSAHGLYLIVKVDKCGRLGGTDWRTVMPMVLTVMPPTVLAEASMTASTTLPLVIAPYDIAKEGNTDIPKHLLWRFPNPLGRRASQRQEEKCTQQQMHGSGGSRSNSQASTPSHTVNSPLCPPQDGGAASAAAPVSST